MSENKKQIIDKVNAAFAAADIEGVLSFCKDDIAWTMVGDTTKRGKDEIRNWINAMQGEAPTFTIDKSIVGEDAVVCYGDMTMKGSGGADEKHSFCDIYGFDGDKIATLRAFIVKNSSADESKAATG